MLPFVTASKEHQGALLDKLEVVEKIRAVIRKTPE
jgi:hypothetical protein